MTVSADAVKSAGRIVLSSVSDDVGPMGGSGGTTAVV